MLTEYTVQGAKQNHKINLQQCWQNAHASWMKRSALIEKIQIWCTILIVNMWPKDKVMKCVFWKLLSLIHNMHCMPSVWSAGHELMLALFYDYTRPLDRPTVQRWEDLAQHRHINYVAAIRACSVCECLREPQQVELRSAQKLQKLLLRRIEEKNRYIMKSEWTKPCDVAFLVIFVFQNRATWTYIITVNYFLISSNLT